MTSRARWFVLAAVALLATAYVLPLWRVDLIAPQYPEGLGMYIRIDGVEGLKPNDLNSINNLNHYIGMKAIVPEAIPELRWMPWILAGLIAGGLAVAFLRRRGPLVFWGGALGLLFAAGLYDYWRWGYDYGHDLDHENAILKIPGMTYQPPLIGSKKLLNFRATSWPSGAGVAWAVAAGLVLAAVVDSRRRRPEGGADEAAGAAGDKTAAGVAGSAGSAALAAVLVLASGCAPPGPRDIVAGQDPCQYCRMEITDARFGTQVVLATGKSLVFDSVECLAGFVRGNAGTALASIWVAEPVGGAWVPAEEAGYLLDGSLRSAMGRVLAFATPAAAAEAVGRYGGQTVSWRAVLADSGGIVAHGASVAQAEVVASAVDAGGR